MVKNYDFQLFNILFAFSNIKRTIKTQISCFFFSIHFSPMNHPILLNASNGVQQAKKIALYTFRIINIFKTI